MTAHPIAISGYAWWSAPRGNWQARCRGCGWGVRTVSRQHAAQLGFRHWETVGQAPTLVEEGE